MNWQPTANASENSNSRGVGRFLASGEEPLQPQADTQRGDVPLNALAKSLRHAAFGQSGRRGEMANTGKNHSIGTANSLGIGSNNRLLGQAPERL